MPSINDSATSVALVAARNHLTLAQLTALRTASEALDSLLVEAVEQRGKWSMAAKDSIDLRVRELLNKLVTCIRVDPFSSEIHDMRLRLVTRRIRRIIRVFKKRPEYRKSAVPNISWDDEFAPAELYERQEGGNLGKAAEIVEGMGNAKAEKLGDRGDQDKLEERREKGKEKEKEQEQGVAGGAGGQAKRKADGVVEGGSVGAGVSSGVQAARKKPKRVYKSNEFITESDEEPTQPDSREPGPSRKPMRNKRQPRYVEPSSEELTPQPQLPQPPVLEARPLFRPPPSTSILPSDPPPDPCIRCTVAKRPCIPRGYRAACESCKAARQSCCHSKLKPPSTTARGLQNPPPANLPGSLAPFSIQKKRKRTAEEPLPPKPPKASRITFRIPPSQEQPARNEAGPSNPAPRLSSRPSSESAGEPPGKTLHSGEQLYAARGQSEAKIALDRLEHLDRRVRELEAGESVREKKNAEAESGWVHSQMKEMGLRVKRMEKRMDDTAVDFNRRLGVVQAVPERLERLEGRVGGQGDLLEMEATQRQQDIREIELQWDRELRRAERRWEDKMEEKMEKVEEQGVKMEERLDRRIEESLARLQIDIERTPWAHDFEHRQQLRLQEIRESFSDRPTMDQVHASYTSNAVTDKIVQQLGQIQLRSEEQQQSLRAGLYTIERLFLHQLVGAVEVDAGARLTEILRRSEGAIRREVEGGASHPGEVQPERVFGVDGMEGEQGSSRRTESGVAEGTRPTGPPAEYAACIQQVDVKNETVSGPVNPLPVLGRSTVRRRFPSVPPPSSPRIVSPRRTRSRARDLQVPSRPKPLFPLLESSAERPSDSSPLTEISEPPAAPLSQPSISEYINMDMVS